jgi:imidazolonepropionase-like amidohydrolase
VHQVLVIIAHARHLGHPRRAGADVIKICTSGGVLSPRDNPRHAHFDMEELRACVAEARAGGLEVVAHAQATDGIKNAIRAGIRSIEHGVYLDDEAISMMLEAGTWLVPTLVAPLGVLEAADRGAAMTEAAVRKAREVVETHKDSFRRASPPACAWPWAPTAASPPTARTSASWASWPPAG